MEQQIRLVLTVPKQQGEPLYAALEQAFEEEGWPLASYDDEAAGQFEISLYIPPEAEAEARARIAQAAGLAAEAIKREELPQIDWVKHSLAGLKPVRAGRFFVHGAHDRDKIRAGEISIEIEANRAFGTGHHGTTAACLELLEQQAEAEKPRNVLDLGTGSGILAIAAAKLGCPAVLATDNDPLAVEIAAENCALNHAGSVRLACAEGLAAAEITGSAPFDMITANILAGVLIGMAAEMRQVLRRGGALILSGILAEQEQAVLAAYAAQGLRHEQTLPKEGWVALLLRG